MRILSVVGNRPQFVKAAPLSVALRDAGVEEVVVHTGQHYDPELSAVFFEDLGLAAPEHELDLRTAEVDPLTSALVALVGRERPDAVLVYGDTNSTLAGARAAAAEGVPVVHVEAGLRSGDLSMPEERNRIEVDRLAALLLCPDERSRETLAVEGVAGRAVVVGDVMADACRLFGPVARQRVEPPHAPGTYAVATLHREANVQPARLARIVSGLDRLDLPVVFPTHPRTRGTLERERIVVAPHVELREPLGYLAFSAAASQARVIVTDSGGLQKEAYWYGVPCVTTRPSTEWVDTVEAGANVLVDDDPDALVAAVASARFPDAAPPLYGDGHAAERIAAALRAL
ncbi:MAG: UDP-N-acetylglucosamine 2-epimerase (non-hydrolyzing) [Thermoleophilia bacterium]|nr:UDP-N-acetylglucosamine 2-epimerase (non-hydrolyzing) [Thermoleophilia bacterium]